MHICIEIGRPFSYIKFMREDFKLVLRILQYKTQSPFLDDYIILYLNKIEIDFSTDDTREDYLKLLKEENEIAIEFVTFSN
jgi:hypothetical protein